MSDTRPPPEGPEIRDVYLDSMNGTMANNLGAILTFTHVATGHTVKFPAAITNITDSHNTELAKEYGWEQNDAIVNMQHGSRKISFSFSVANSSIEEARYNAQSINLLLCMMYPAMSGENGWSAIGPVIKIHGMNFIQSSDSARGGMGAYITNLVYKPDLTNGLITNKGSGTELYPRIITFSVEADVLIDHSPSVDMPIPDNFPNYGVPLNVVND